MSSQLIVITAVTKNASGGAIFYVSLESQAATGAFQANPTLAAGDVKISIDGGAYANLGTLPTVTPAAGKGVKVTLSQAETNGDNLHIVFSDAAGAEWNDLGVTIQTTPQNCNLTQIDGLATSGNNATLNLKQFNVVNSAGSAIVATGGGSNGHGIIATGASGGTGIRGQGNAGGAGIQGLGGTTGNGIAGLGGSTSGNGIAGTAATSGHGLSVIGAGGGNGLFGQGQGSGSGIHGQGGTDGISGQGYGVGAGLAVHGGADNGGGFGNGAGIYAASDGNGAGMQLWGGDGITGGASYGLIIDGGHNGGALIRAGGVGLGTASNQPAIHLQGHGTAAGFRIEGGATGNGMEAIAGVGGTAIVGNISQHVIAAWIKRAGIWTPIVVT